MGANGKRIEVVDALRGFAIVAIMLLHNIEHFDFYFTPENLPAWMVSVDGVIWDSLFFLFGGKAYAIFAFLFGLTFFIQSNNQAKKGKDFRGRFAWRMLLLLGFGLLNSAFYQGDILTIYAVIGIFIIPFANLGTTAVLVAAVVLMLQPVEWVKLLIALQEPAKVMQDPLSWSYFGKAAEYIPGSSVVDVWIGNLTNGKIAVLLWNWENARVFQTLSLFLLGMLAGRTSLFAATDENRKKWIRVFFFAIVAFIPLYIVKNNLDGWISSVAVLRPLATIETSLSNVAFMFVLVSGFVLLFQYKMVYRALHLFTPIGKMSLSNYIIQSILGSSIYYGFGLAMYKYTGALYSLLIGLVLVVIQGVFSSWWMSNHKQGPLETIWHRLTWVEIGKTKADMSEKPKEIERV